MAYLSPHFLLFHSFFPIMYLQAPPGRVRKKGD
nr:MAG TPA: hypothetical protein [Caudoviricetes sp.]